MSSSSQEPPVVVPARTHRRRAVVLALLGVFQLWVWGTRLWNIAEASGDFSTAFVGVHVLLFVTGIGVGVVLAVLAWRQWREVRLAASAPQPADAHQP